MAKYIKILCGMAGVCTAVLLPGTLLLALAFDPNEFKSDIESALRNNIGLVIPLGDDLTLSLFPRLTIATSQLSLSKPPSFGDTLLEKPKAILREKKQELIERLDEKLGPGARKLFENFF
ncbi:MAG: hypothetical protein ABFS02_10800 [Pseudomonadota bacterium]